MSWNDPHSPWTRKLKRRILFNKLTFIVGFLPAIVIFAYLWWSHFSSREEEFGGLPGEIIAIAVFPLFMMAIAAAILLWRLRVEQTVLKEVPKRDGHFCPRCRTVLPKEPPQGDCPKCHTPYTRTELQAYWVDYVLEPQRLRPWGAKLSWRQRLINLRNLTLKNFLANTIMSIVMLLAALFLMWHVTSLSFTGVVVRYLPLFLGFALVGPGSLFLRRYLDRTGQTRHCTTCGYQQAPQGENPQRCPECGADWSHPGGAIIGTQTRRPRYLWLACGFFGAAAVLIIAYHIALFSRVGWTLRVLPTSALIYDATTSDGFTRAEWKEIQRRQLTPEQQRQLAVGLLDKRLRDEYLDNTECGWLWTMVSTSALPDDLIERYCRETLEVWINTPATATVGKPFNVSLGSIFRRNNSPAGFDEVVYFGGFFVGDDPIPRARQKDNNYCGLLDGLEYIIHTQITPSRANPLRIRAVFYFAVGTKLGRDKTSIQWHDDETATLPPVAIWSRRIEIEQTITVNE